MNNNFEQSKPAQEPKSVAEIIREQQEGVEAWQKSRQERMAQKEKSAQGPQSATERAKKYSEEADKLGQKIQERRAQREEAVKAKESAETQKPDEPRGGSTRVQEGIQQIEQEMTTEKAKSVAPAGPEVKTPLESDEESKEAQWKAAAVHERETSMEKIRRLFTKHGETGGAEAKTVETAKQNREETIEEISRHLVERPGEALSIFKKGVGLKLEKATIGFTSFWKKAGAEVLKGLSLPAEKAVGLPLGKVSETVWLAEEFLEKRPGAKRLEHVLAIQTHIENLKKAGVITEGHADYLLAEIMKHVRHATGDLLAETRDHYFWEERKKRTLGAMKTFGHLGEKLSGWGKRQKAEAAGKKETAKQKRAGKIAEKF